MSGLLTWTHARRTGNKVDGSGTRHARYSRCMLTLETHVGYLRWILTLDTYSQRWYRILTLGTRSWHSRMSLTPDTRWILKLNIQARYSRSTLNDDTEAGYTLDTGSRYTRSILMLDTRWIYAGYSCSILTLEIHAGFLSLIYMLHTHALDSLSLLSLHFDERYLCWIHVVYSNTLLTLDTQSGHTLDTLWIHAIFSSSQSKLESPSRCWILESRRTKHIRHACRESNRLQTTRQREDDQGKIDSCCGLIDCNRLANWHHKSLVQNLLTWSSSGYSAAI